MRLACTSLVSRSDLHAHIEQRGVVSRLPLGLVARWYCEEAAAPVDVVYWIVDLLLLGCYHCCIVFHATLLISSPLT